MADYPASLPRPRSDGYRLKPIEAVERTNMETGSMRSRRRTKARNDRVLVSFAFTRSEMSIFRDWFDDDTTGADGGAAWFNMVLDIGDGAAVSQETKFAKVWEAQRKGALWIVNAELEVR